MTVGSLFAGIGGFDLGFERAGYEIVWQVEIDDYCRRVLERHFPGADRSVTDVRQAGRHNLAPVDVICGGFPCKQTSTIAAVHKRRHGLDGQDSGLWWEYLRIVQAIRPIWVVVENVAGISSWANTITLGLEGIGYSVSQSQHQVSDFGAPHSRRRVLFIAHLDGAGLQTSWQRRTSQVIEKNWPAPTNDLWREHKPGAWRMDDGVPNRVDRLRGLGNAIVPQIAQWIAERIKLAADPSGQQEE